MHRRIGWALALFFASASCAGAPGGLVQEAKAAEAKPEAPKVAEAKPDTISTPCLSADEYRQFDFWLGEWDVFTPKGEKAGENVISRESKGCLVLESWSGTRGGVGKSMSFYDPARKQWRQVWVGSGGAISEFSGKFEDGAMRFVSEPRPGMDDSRRLTFFHLGPDTVRQLSERTSDGGKTYFTEYDFTYRRRAPK